MTLVVEDGTGRSDAESYISVENADARHAAFGNTAWTGDDITKEQALRAATAYMEQAYRSTWKGTRLTQEQALSWPRWDVCVDGWLLPNYEVPADVANACADLALRALGGTALNADQTRGVVRERVGPIETEYDRFSQQATRYRAIDMALAPLLKGSSAMATLVRA